MNDDYFYNDELLDERIDNECTLSTLRMTRRKWVNCQQIFVIRDNGQHIRVDYISNKHENLKSRASTIIQ